MPASLTHFSGGQLLIEELRQFISQMCHAVPFWTKEGIATKCTKSQKVRLLCFLCLFVANFPSPQNRSQFLEPHIQSRLHCRNRSTLYGRNLFEFKTLKDLKDDDFPLILR